MDPSPPQSPKTPPTDAAAFEKARLRKAFRKARRVHVEALPDGLRALVLNRPPAPVAARLAEARTIGVYHPVGDEAPALGWARWLAEQGHAIALPWFAGRDPAMTFRVWTNPFDERSLVASPWGGMQPPADADEILPDAIVVPLIAFTAEGLRLGQGGGHYDRWLAAHPDVATIGLGWDCQLAETLPAEPHDRPLGMVVTPTRIFASSAE